MTNGAIALLATWFTVAAVMFFVGLADMLSSRSSETRGKLTFVLSPIWPLALVAFYFYHAYQLVKPFLPKRTEKEVDREPKGPYR